MSKRVCWDSGSDECSTLNKRRESLATFYKWKTSNCYLVFQFQMESLKEFSILKNIKQHKRSSLSNELLDDLLAINVDNVNIEDSNADGRIDLWWKAKFRRCNQHPRKEYQKRKAVSDEASPDVIQPWNQEIFLKTGTVG